MKSQRSMYQKKEQDKTPEKTTKWSEDRQPSRKKEFRIMIVKMIQVLGETMKKFQEMFTKDLEELKQTNKQTNKKTNRHEEYNRNQEQSN